MEKRYLRKDGSLFWGRVNFALVRDEAGRPLYIIGLIEDITEEKAAQQKVAESEARFRAMYENAAIGISLIAPDGRVLAVNPVLVQLSGYSESELLASGGQSITHPGDLDVGQREFAEILAGERNSFQVEKRYIHKDGRAHWMRQSISAVRDPAGKVLYLVVIAEDIDQRKRATEELRESEARFRAMYNNAAVGMAMISLDRRILSINETSARITGYSVEELVNTDPAGFRIPMMLPSAWISSPIWWPAEFRSFRWKNASSVRAARFFGGGCPTLLCRARRVSRNTWWDSLKILPRKEKPEERWQNQRPASARCMIPPRWASCW